MAQVSLADVPQELERAFLADPANAGKTSEQSNVDVMARMLGAIAAGDMGALHAFLAPDVTLEIAVPDWVPWVRHAAGADAVAEAIAANFASVREQRPELVSLVAQGDTVMAMAYETGVWVESDAPYEILVAQQYSFREGKLAAFRSVAASHRRLEGRGS